MNTRTRKAEDLLPWWIMAVGVSAGIGIAALLSLESHRSKPAAADAGAVKTPALALAQPKAVPASSKPAIAQRSRSKTLPSPQEDAARQQVADLLDSPDLGNAPIADKLLALLPKLPESLHAEAAMHIANLGSAEAENSPPAWSQALLEDRLPPDAQRVLFPQLCSLPSKTSLPLLAAIADNPNHPLRQPSANFLEPILGPNVEGGSWVSLLSTQGGFGLQAAR